MGKYFSIQTFVTVAVALVLFYIIMYWLSPSKSSTGESKPSEATLKTKSDCEKYGYKWNEEKQVCEK